MLALHQSDSKDPIIRIWSAKELILETSALECLYSGQIAFVINSVDKPNILFYSPPTQHHSFYKNKPYYLLVRETLSQLPCWVHLEVHKIKVHFQTIPNIMLFLFTLFCFMFSKASYKKLVIIGSLNLFITLIHTPVHTYMYMNFIFT